LNRIFVDTAAWIALFNRTDGLHQQTKQLMARLKREKRYLLTTEFVLLEVADAFAEPSVRSLTIEYVNRLRFLSSLRILPVSSDLFDEGWTLYGQRLDKGGDSRIVLVLSS
jgi:uncharacterized protein